MWRSQSKPSGTLTPISSVRVPVKLVNGVLGEWVTLIARATVQVATAAATNLRSKGSVFALFDEIVIDENGADRHIYTGPVLRHISEMNAPSSLTARRIIPNADGTVAIGTYTLEESARIFFAWPSSLDPTETAFVERDPRQSLNLQVRMVASPAAALLNAGTAVVTVSGISVDVVHGFRLPTAGASRPLFVPTSRQIVVPINGTVTQQAEYLRSPNLIRGMVVSQEVIGAGEVSDILTPGGFVLRGDFTTPVGPGVASFRNRALSEEYESGGSVVQGALNPHLGFNFQKFGKLSECLNPAQDTNLRFEFSGQPSATAGGSQIRITLLELTRIPGLTADEIPFPY